MKRSVRIENAEHPKRASQEPSSNIDLGKSEFSYQITFARLNQDIDRQFDKSSIRSTIDKKIGSTMQTMSSVSQSFMRRSTAMGSAANTKCSPKHSPGKAQGSSLRESVTFQHLAKTMGVQEGLYQEEGE